LDNLLELRPFDGTRKLGVLINHLKVQNCNLPVCAAIASFLYRRQYVPILDKFLAQFFAREFKTQLVDQQTGQVLN
jgi:hypothetical protein